MPLSAFDKQETVSRYKERFNRFGYSPQSLGWRKGKQMVRFDALTSLFEIEGRSILDVGCGFGDLNRLLVQKAKNYEYLGIDLVDELIDFAKNQYNNHAHIEFLKGDFIETEFDRQFDYVVGAGIFNYKYKDINNYDLVQEVFQKAFSICKEGIAFDFLSDKVDFQYDFTFHHAPEKILSIAYNFTNNVVLRNDYMPFEFSIILFKDDSFAIEDTLFNRYKLHSKLR